MSERSWPADVFERIYAERPDPWGFESNPYERAKYADTLAALDGRSYRNGLELGCSIGVMTEALAARCDALLAVDISATALARARTRCAALPGVRFAQAALPDGLPALDGGSCDLLVLSELLYFLSPHDIDRLMAGVLAAAAPDAVILLVNWTGPTNTPCTGDQAADRARACCAAAGRRLSEPRRRDGYRLDRIGESWSRPGALA